MESRLSNLRNLTAQPNKSLNLQSRSYLAGHLLRLLNVKVNCLNYKYSVTQNKWFKRSQNNCKKNDEAQLTTAIIGKTLAQCQQLTVDLQAQGVKVTLIKTENQRLAAGNIIVPAFLAKGLEFDAVIMWDASEQNYHDEDERQLVYTICSRAMHQLNVVALNELSRLFKRISTDSYELITD